MPFEAPHTPDSSGPEGHDDADTHGGRASVPEETTLADTIAEICAWHRRRLFAMDARKRSDLALGAFLRTTLGWSPALPADERAAIAGRAAELVTIAAKALKQEEKPADKRRTVEGEDAEDYRDWSDVIRSALLSRAPFAAVEEKAEMEMDRLAQTLPVWPWWRDNVFRKSAVSLAVVVAEAGDLSNYANPGKLWKRMGMAPISKDGRTRAGSSWRGGGLTKDDWTAVGYSMRRRSLMFVIGGSLVKGKSYLRGVYLDRKEYLRDRATAVGLTIAPAAKIPKKRAAEFISLGHIDRDAQRYMEKRLLKHLWRAWRAVRLVSPNAPLPANLSPDAGE